MKKIILIAFLVFYASIANSQELKQDNSKTKVAFKIRNLGVNVDGSFSKIAIKSNFNSQNITGSYLNASIAVKTIDTNNDTRNESLAKKEYFDVDNYEYIKLASTKITKKSETDYILTGKLTIKATTKTIEIPLVVSETNDSIAIKSSFELNRLDYNVGKKSWVMSNTVKIEVYYVAKK